MSTKRQDYISWDEYFMGVAMLSFSTLNETLKYLEIGLALKSLFNIKQ